MLTLLLTLLACTPAPGHDPTTYEACITWTEMQCECGNIQANAADPEYFCDPENAQGSCAMYDMRYCDTQDEMFDASSCEYVHDSATDELTEWYNCWNSEQVGKDECVSNADQYEACGDYPAE